MRRVQLDVPQPVMGRGEKGKERVRVDCQHWLPPGKVTGDRGRRGTYFFFYCIFFVPFAFVSSISINFQKIKWEKEKFLK